MIGASVIAIIALLLGMYFAPMASKGFNEFEYKYFKSGKKAVQDRNVYRQINDNDFIYVSSFNAKRKQGQDFTLEHFEGNEMTYKISAKNIRYIEKDSTYRLIEYVKRRVGKINDTIENVRRKDTLFSFDLVDLTPVEYIAETLSYRELTDFIEKEGWIKITVAGNEKTRLYQIFASG